MNLGRRAIALGFVRAEQVDDVSGLPRFMKLDRIETNRTQTNAQCPGARDVSCLNRAGNYLAVVKLFTDERHAKEVPGAPAVQCHLTKRFGEIRRVVEFLKPNLNAGNICKRVGQQRECVEVEDRFRITIEADLVRLQAI